MTRRLDPALLPRLVFLLTVGAVVLFMLGAAAYPGGSHFDRNTVGHDFWRNSLCDLTRATAIGGAPNPVGAALARTAMTLLAIAIGGFFWLLPSHFAHARVTRIVRSLGITSAVASLAVIHLPTDRYGGIHGTLVVLATVPGLTATIFACASLVRKRPQSALPWLGIATLTISAIDFAFYVDELVQRRPPQLTVPILEHLAALLLLTWILLTAANTARANRPRKPSPSPHKPSLLL